MHQREERERRVGLLLFRENEGEREDFGETVRQFLEEWREFLSHGICGQRGDRVERRFCLHRRKLCAEGAKESVLCTVYERECVCSDFVSDYEGEWQQKFFGHMYLVLTCS
jgi:hypothetical protein